jgi:L-alanine-DL-glutamate epimerase-like enolase superfamily enzyme
VTTISKITVKTHCNDIGGKVWNPAIRWTKKFAVFIVIEDDTGRQGIGECWCFDTAPDALCAYLRTEVIPQFLNLSLDEVSGVIARMIKKATLTARHGILASATAGIDIAAHDLRAQHQSLPLWKSLNHKGTGRTRFYASGGLYGQNKDIAALVTEFEDMVEQGFDLMKMKVGALDRASDLARVKAVLAALPNTTKLIIDGVYSYTPDEAQRLFEELPSDRIEAFQSPVAAADIQGMARLTKAGVPVMGTEAEYRTEIHEKLIHDGAVAFLQTAPVACGGFNRLGELVDLVKGTDVRLSLEVSSTDIALTAACHFAAAHDVVAHVEYHFLHRVFFEHSALPQNEGFPRNCVAPMTEGLGVSIPPDQTETVFEMTVPIISEEPRQAVGNT